SGLGSRFICILSVSVALLTLRINLINLVFVSQWELPSRPPMLGFQPSAGVDLVPVFPPVYRTLLPPHYGKAWLEKRAPDYKVYLNNTLALETTWISPEEVGLFQRQEKPMMMTNQVAMSISRPAAASRNFHTLLLTPRRVSGRRENFIILCSRGSATDALMAMESDVTQGPSASSAHPLHLLSLSPIKIPILTLPSAARARCVFACMSASLLSLRLQQVCVCVCKKVFPLISLCICRCVVWTGDDRVFFFNPTMQLSVWDKPVDLKDRGDINKIIEDPPHKRKKDSLGKGREDHISKSKQKTDDKLDENNTERCKTSNQMVLPLELRITHFRDMLLERGVSSLTQREKFLQLVVISKQLGKERKSKIAMVCKNMHDLFPRFVSRRSTFKEFSEKYSRDPRFKQVPKPKDQELLFSQFVSSLKKRDKENRMRLRKMR
uniref:Transcription elongation regulator 1 like n=1 Tax=Astyanax mexicanus TaxID=7994 RepID=A0A8B9K340_ASTMX